MAIILMTLSTMALSNKFILIWGQKRRYDTLPNGNHHNDTKHNGIDDSVNQHSDIQHGSKWLFHVE
jgi:hypothetical protein